MSKWSLTINKYSAYDDGYYITSIKQDYIDYSYGAHTKLKKVSTFIQKYLYCIWL